MVTAARPTWDDSSNDRASVRLTSRGRDAVSTFASWNNLAICYGRQPPTGRNVGNYRFVLESMTKLYPQGVGLITIVARVSTPGADAREPLLAVFRDLWPQLIASAFVIEATGFAAAVQRSVAGALILGVGVRDRIKVADSLSSSLLWMNERFSAASAPFPVLALENALRAFCTAEDALGADPPLSKPAAHFPELLARR